ncbi:MAG: hypothetical protein ABIT83_22125 [Massilia sp.]
MKKTILLIQGHPDAAHPHLCGALVARLQCAPLAGKLDEYRPANSRSAKPLYKRVLKRRQPQKWLRFRQLKRRTRWRY